MNIKQLSEICEQKILDVIVNHVRIRKTIIGKWVMSLPEWLDTLQVSLLGIKYPDWSLSLVSSSPRCLSGWPSSRPLCSTPWWWPASPRWARPGTGTPCCCSSPPVSVRWDILFKNPGFITQFPQTVSSSVLQKQDVCSRLRSFICECYNMNMVR